MIRLKNFSIGFHDKTLLQDISTIFKDGELTAMIGKNGAGKSTVLKAICGLNKKYSGNINIDNENIKQISPNKLAKKIAYVNTQRPRIANLRCKDVVSLGRSPYTGWNGKLSSYDEEIVDKALETVGMKEYSDRYFNTLSDGESQKIMIARAITQQTEIIILDEPTSFLDLPTRYELVELLKRLSKSDGTTIIFSTHELDIALKFADYIALLESPDLINLPTIEMKALLQETKHPFSCFL